MNYVWTWVFLTILTDAITLLIRATVFVAFAECKPIKKYFIEPTDKIWSTLERYFDDLSELADRGDQSAKKWSKSMKLVMGGMLLCYYTVPFGAIVLGLIVDPILCYRVATGRIRIG